MNTEWSKPTKYIVSIGLTLFALYIIYLSRSVLTILIVASLISFLLLPIVDFFQQRCRLPRGLAVLLSVVLLILVVLLSPLIFVPPIVDGFNVLAKVDYQILVDNVLSWTQSTLITLKNTNTQLLGFTIDLNPLLNPALNLIQNTESNFSPTLPPLETIMNSFRSAATITFGLATNVAGTLVASIVTFVITLLSIIYITLDAHKFSHYFLEVVPAPYRPEIAKLVSHLGKTWRAYFRGQLNLMIIIGLVTWVGNMAIGLPGAFALAVIAGLMELIPNLGPFLAAVPAVVVALIQGSTYLNVGHLTFALIVIGLYIAIQQLENTFVVPRVLGEAVDLHPLVVMMGVVVGASVAGILGALLAAPVIASLREIVNYLYAKILGKNPYPPEAEEIAAEKSSWREVARGWLAWGQQYINPRRPPSQAGETQTEAPVQSSPSTQVDPSTTAGRPKEPGGA
jgi:predicted PurR-regulated permease PerM